MMGSNDRSFPVPQARVDGQQMLPSSAPVSSLLPPIPSNHTQLLQQHLQASIQAQIAALLSHGAQQPPVTPSIGIAGSANSSHLRAATTAVVATPVVGVIPPNPLMSTVDMHGWSVEQIGRYKLTYADRLLMLQYFCKAMNLLSYFAAVFTSRLCF